MRALITGGTGFIGSHLAERLAKEGISVVVAARGESPNCIPHEFQRDVEMVRGDLANESFCRKIVIGCDLVSHLACLVSEGQSRGETSRFWATNAGGTLNILKAARDAKVVRFHYMSGPSVVGNVPSPQRAQENWEIPPPATAYSLAKLSGEICCQTYFERYRLPVVVTRPFNVYGPRQSPNAKGGMVARFIMDVLEGSRMRIVGDGEQSRDWLYVTDVVDAIYRCLTTDGVEGELFHIASGRDAKVKDVATLVARVCDANYRLRPKYLREATDDIQRSCGNPAKAERLLRWKPSVDLRRGIGLTSDSMRIPSSRR